MEENKDNAVTTPQGTPEEPVNAPESPTQPPEQFQSIPGADAVAMPAAPVAPQASSTSGLAVAGLVLGILAILGAFIPLLNILTMPFAIIGLILAVVGLLGINKGKHSGKGIAIAGIVLGAVALVVTIGMYGCAGAVASSNAGSSSSAASSASTAAETLSSQAGAEAVQADFVGTWDVVGAKTPQETVSTEEFDAARANGSDFFLNLYENGTCVFVPSSSDSAVKGKWESEGADAFKLVFADMTITVPVKNGKGTMQIEDTTFQLQKIDKMKDPTAVKGASASEASSNAANDADSAPEEPAADAGGVSPDVKEALDSYEAVMDEYVAFMQKYKDSGYSASMLGDYTSMLQKYTEFSQKIEAMDTDNMSTADYQYYIEVTSRVSQKLLDVAM